MPNRFNNPLAKQERAQAIYGHDQVLTHRDEREHENIARYFRDIFSKLPHNTQRAYLSDLNEFMLFCSSHGFEGVVDNFEQNESCIKAYVTELCKSPLAYRTIKRRLSALSKLLSIAKYPNPIIRSAYLRDFIRLSLIENKKYSFSYHQAVPLTIELGFLKHKCDLACSK